MRLAAKILALTVVFFCLAYGQSPPTGLTVQTVTSNSATLKWDGQGNNVKFDVEVSGGNPSGKTNAGASWTVTGLSPNTTYSWSVTAYKGSTPGRGDPSTSGPDFTTQPATPSPPSVSVTPTYSSATFTFGTVSGGAFEVEVFSDRNMTINVGGGTTNPTTVDGLSSSTTYYYWATVTVSGQTSNQKTGSFTTPTPPQPSPPSVSVTTTYNSATFSFTAVTGGSFDVEVFDDKNMKSNVGGGSSNPTTVENLLSSTTYYYSATVTVSGQTSNPKTGQFTTSAQPLQPPKAPSSLSASPTTTSATLSWRSGSGATSYDYEVYSDAFVTLLSGDNTSSTSGSVSGLSGGKTYYWRVRSVNAAGSSVWVTSQFRTPTPPPPAPGGLKATTTSTEATLSWVTVSQASSYDVEVYSDATFSKEVWGGSSTSGSANASGLTANTKYYWRVRSVNTGGTSDWIIGSFTTSAPPPAPPKVTAAPTGASVTFTFTAVTGATSYDVQVTDKQNNGTVVGSGSTTDATKSIVVTGLQSKTKYYYSATVTASGQTSDASTGSFTTLDASTLPPAPSVRLNATANSATFTFTAVTGATSYDVRVLEKQGGGTVVGSGSTSDPTKPVVVTGLQSKTKYDYEATATISGQTGQSATGSFTTLDASTLPPAPSVTLSATANSVTFSFTAVTGATSYDVRVLDKQGGGTVVGSGSTADPTKPVVVTGLQPKTKYDYEATATISGQTSQGATGSFTTLDASTLPPAPSVTFNATANSVTFTFTAVTGAASYDVRVLDKQAGGTVVGTGSTADPKKPVVVTGLQSKTKYDYEATATISGQTSQGATGSFTTLDASTLPPAPSVTFNATANSVTFTFVAVSNATSYDVQITDKQNNGNVVGSGSTSDATKAVVVSGLDSKTKYYYTATVTVSGQTSNAATGSFTTLDASTLPPAPAVRLNATANSVTFTFTAVTGATSYDVRVLDKQAGGTVVGSGSTTDPTKPVVVTGLQSKIKYDYEATATISGQTSQGATGSFTTLDATTLPPAPSVTVNATANSVTFTFVAVGNATSYDVQVTDKQNNGTVVGSGSTTDATKPVVVPGLESKTKYYYTATATISGQTSQAATGSFTTLDASTLPPAPSVTFNATANSVTFTFVAVSNATSYDVQVTDKQNNGNVVGSGSTSDAKKPVVVSGLDSKTKYYYSATATVSGQTSQAATGSFTTMDASTLPPAPSVKLSATANSVTFSFTAVTGATSYDVRVLDKQGSGKVVGTGSTADPTKPIVVTGLQSKTKYDYEATATVSGQTSQAATGSFTTLDASTLPPAPSVTLNATTNSVTFTFSAVTGAASYDVRVLDKQDGGTVVGSGSTADPTKPVVVTGLQPKTKYDYEATATTSGYTSQAATGSFTTPDAASAVEKIDAEIPGKLYLSQNYPNPFNPSTNIEFSVPSSSHVTIAVFNALGIQIRTLVDAHYHPGRYLVTWDASAFPSGVYFCRILSQNFVDTKRLVLLK